MTVLVVRVREVCMGMLERRVAVPVPVRLAGGRQRFTVGMAVQVVPVVVAVLVVVLDRVVLMPVLVVLGEVQPHAHGHQRAGQQQRR